MYDFGKLWRDAVPGLRDLLALPRRPALSAAAAGLRFRAWGPAPRAVLVVVAAVSVAIGIAQVAASFEVWFDLWNRVRWPVVVFSIGVAVQVRARVPRAEVGAFEPNEGFRAVFEPVVTAAAVLAIGDALLQAAVHGRGMFAPDADGFAVAAGSMQLASSIVANLTAVACLVAAFAYTRSWGWAALHVFGAFVLFLITVFVLQLVVIGLAPLGSLCRLAAGLIGGAVLPERALDLIDVTAYTVLLGGICLAVTGSFWWHARAHFGRLLAGEDVELFAVLEAQAKE